MRAIFILFETILLCFFLNTVWTIPEDNFLNLFFHSAWNTSISSSPVHWLSTLVLPKQSKATVHHTMDSHTYDSLEQRLDTLKVDIGDSNEPSLVKQVAQLQARLNQLYQQNPELGILDLIRKEFPKPRQSRITEGSNSKEQKQETILIKYPQIKIAYQSLMELLSIEMPQLPSEIAEKLDIEQIAVRENQLKVLANNFHMMVVKNLVVLEKYVGMAENEARFWNRIEKKVNQLGAQVNAVEHDRRMESKY